jgi:pyruvate formate lyase activating enzyme
VHDTEGGTTYCPHCAKALIVRDWYQLLDYRLDDGGHCRECGGAVAGRFQALDIARQFGPKRVPVRLSAA